MTGNGIHRISPLSISSSTDSFNDKESTPLVAIDENLGTFSDTPTVAQSLTSTTCIFDDTASDMSITELAAVVDRPSPRLDTKPVAVTDLPWSIDETSSSCALTSQGRKSSYIPPPPRAGQRGSVDSAQTEPLHISAASNSSTAHTAPSTPHSVASSNALFPDLSHPPGYAQNSRGSFSDTSAHGSFYDSDSPFYKNASIYSSALSTPVTPPRRGRGILDNDPSLYLQEETHVEGNSVWDAATKWAKIAGKRLSVGEQQLWKMVSSVTNG